MLPRHTHTHTLALCAVTVSRHVWIPSFLNLESAICLLCYVSQPKDPHIRLSSLQSCEVDRPVLFVKHLVCAIIKQRQEATPQLSRSREHTACTRQFHSKKKKNLVFTHVQP